MRRSIVVFPHPEGPTKAVNSFSRSATVTSLSAVIWPERKLLLTRSAAIGEASAPCSPTIAVGWTYLVIAEIVGAQDGIGAVMMRAGRFLHVDIIMAGILTIGVLGVLTDIAFRIVAHLLFPWNVARPL